MKRIFLTGATGFVGSYLAYELLKKGYKLILLVRGSKDGAEARVKKSLAYLLDGQDEYYKLKKNIELISGDISEDNLGIDAGVLTRLRSEVDAVFHCAALTGFEEGCRDQLRQHNVEGTRQLLDFTLRLKNPELHHVSTAYVCGRKNGVSYEDELDTGQIFNNPYEESKCEAEKLIWLYRQKHSFHAAIYRPSIIVGDSAAGRTSNFTGAYSFIKAIVFLTELFTRDLGRDGGRAQTAGVSFKENRLNIPLRISAISRKTLNIVPVDYVVSAMISAFEQPGPDGKTYHLVNPSPPTLEKLNAALSSILNITGLTLTEPEDFETQPMTEWERFFIESIQEVGPYLTGKEPAFDDSNTRAVLTGTQVRCPEMTGESIATLVSYYISRKGIKI